MSIPAGVIGASGFAGGELLRLLAGHPEFEVSYASASGRREGPTEPPLAAIHPGLRGSELARGGQVLARTSVSTAARRCRVVFLATPPEVSATLAGALLDAGVEAVVDLSPAFRLTDPALHQRWYPAVRRPPGAVAVYGLPELNRAKLGGARLIAVPGCLATAAILALLPLSGLPGLSLAGVVIDGKVGSTGSGNRVRRSGLHAVRSGVVAPYAPAGHRHTAEIREAMAGRALAGREPGGGERPLRLGMSVFGIDLVRGLSVAVHALTGEDAGWAGHDADLTGLLRDTYAREPFIRVRDRAAEAVPLPDPKAVIGSNYCDIAAFHDAEAARIVVVAALDNLMKGAAGQAVQACNIRYGLPEDAGLTALPIYPA